MDKFLQVLGAVLKKVMKVWFQGSGWWKFEFCYGNKVEQYHEERGGTRTTILLGKFSLNHHKTWLKNVSVIVIMSFYNPNI